MTLCKDSRTVCLYCSLDGDKIAEFVGYLHVRRLLACSSATCISVGYSIYMCQFSFNIKAPLFVCSSLALNLLTTRLVNWKVARTRRFNRTEVTFLLEI